MDKRHYHIQIEEGKKDDYPFLATVTTCPECYNVVRGSSSIKLAVDKAVRFILFVEEEHANWIRSLTVKERAKYEASVRRLEREREKETKKRSKRGSAHEAD